MSLFVTFLSPKLHFFGIFKLNILRVVQTQANLFSKLMSERGGSDIERLWSLNLQSILSRSINSSFYFEVVVCRIRLFPTLISKIKWPGSGLPLTGKYLCLFIIYLFSIHYSVFCVSYVQRLVVQWWLIFLLIESQFFLVF